MIKDATPDNLDDLIALNAQVQKLHAELEPSHFRAAPNEQETRTFFADVLARNNNQIIMAFEGDRPVGYLWFEIQNRPQTPFTHARQRAYVHHIAVDVSARRRGVASALVLRLEQIVRARGIHGIVLDTWASNREAQAFFSAAGFSAFNLVLGKTLEPLAKI